MKAPSGLDVIEQAVQLLRKQPANAWVVHLAGAVPLLLSTLYLVSDMRLGAFTAARCAGEALLCVACLIWFNVCRARFSRLLTSSLAGDAPGSWKPALSPANLSWQLVKPYVLPAAFCMILPAASAVSFFRTKPILPGKPGFREAARVAGLWPKQNWEMLAALAAFSVVAFLNITIFLVILPALAKTTLGLENAFTRMGPSFALILFWLAVGLTWLAVDPLYQAAYVVRYFLLESRRTGMDLLVSLARLGVMAMALLFCGQASAAQPVVPADLDRSISHVIEQREYSWHNPDEPSIGADAIARVLHSMSLWAERTMDAIGKFFDRIFRSNPEKADQQKQSGGFSVGWTIAILAFVAVLGSTGFIMVALRRAADRPTAAASPRGGEDVALEDPALTAADLPEERWLELARECSASQEFRLALRALYLANLSYLGRRQLLHIAPAKSNRDYRVELTRRVRNEEVWRVFAENVRTFEYGWYGTRDVALSDVDLLQRNMDALRSYVEA